MSPLRRRAAAAAPYINLPLVDLGTPPTARKAPFFKTFLAVNPEAVLFTPAFVATAADFFAATFFAADFAA